MRILLAEDEGAQRETLRELLSARGHEVRAFPCVALALIELYSGYEPDVIILDLKMPGCHAAPDGTALLARLREEPRWCDIPVIVTTGRKDFDPPPGVTLLTKPYDFDTLFAALVRLAPLARQE